MKKVILFIGSLSIVPSLFGQDLTWADGSWTGTGFQSNTNGTWSMNFYADSRDNYYMIEYPSLACGGQWVVLNVEFHKLEFVEGIRHGKDRCIDGGRIILSYVDDQHTSFTYFMPNSTELGASATLTRMK